VGVKVVAPLLVAVVQHDVNRGNLLVEKRRFDRLIEVLSELADLICLHIDVEPSQIVLFVVLVNNRQQLLVADRVFNRAHNQGCFVTAAYFLNNFSKFASITRSMHINPIHICTLSFHLVVNILFDCVQVHLGVTLGEEGADEMCTGGAFLQHQVVAEVAWVNNIAFTMVETTLAVHLSLAPLANVTMTMLSIAATALLLGPNVHAKAILDSIFNTATILTLIRVDDVALTRLPIE